ncbi:MAG TPA: signal peptidase I [Actinomycetes bacterium]|nr:signal peptidase I [Actinomycetes bacterium]
MNHDGTRGADEVGMDPVTSTGSVPAPRNPRSAGRPAARHVLPRRPARRPMVVEIAIVVVLSLALSALIKTFLVQAFYIPSGSMENTLQLGDRILVNKLATRFDDLHRGDVVVFEDPGGWLHPEDLPQREGLAKLAHDVFVGLGVLPSEQAGDLVKRIIGLPGDHVVCCDDQGRVTVNGVALSEPYLYPGNEPSDTPFDVKVPAGQMWVMGDHRQVSQDSRAHQEQTLHGMVPMADVVGRVFVVIWPFDRFQRVERPASFGQVAAGP